ncbi:hypothetical protein LG047_15300 [Methylocystis sp. WRRC1]|uniref:hypothetical protein n=1 Tax=Methylocystis sp. WRRC1 TaxID=1732014 RepID=UPI001D157BB8|nr:hypothetical protein [Methylocystis sp. WRRC1]MCC3246666.1 hypothetical protein [Methylocystis sp. WRRC1]
MKKLLIALLSIVALPAFGQSLPSPKYQDVTINGSLIFKPCTGYLYAGADGSTTCVAANGLAPDTPSLSGANSWLSPQTFGSNGAVTGEARFANGAGTGASVVVRNNAAEAAYYFNLPSTAGTDGYVLTSGGGGTEPMRWSPLAAVAASGSASDLVSGTLAAARGGAGTINGALKGNGSGVVSKAASTDLSDSANIGRLNTENTWTAAQTINSLTSNSILSTQLPGLSSNVQSAGQGPGLDGGTWFIWQRPDAYTSVGPFRTDRHMWIGCPGDSTGATCGSSSTGFQSIRNNYTLNASTNPDNAQWEWGESATFYNSARPGMAAQNGAGGFQNHKVRAVNSTTAASGTGGTATITFNTSSLVGSPYVFPVGYDIFVNGVTPSGYNGQHTVTASSPGSVSFASATTGSQTVAGELGHALTGCTAIGGNLAKLEYSHPGVLIPFASASGTGATATLTFDSKYKFSVNDEIVVTGAGAYNGTHTITAVGTGTLSFASAATGTTTGTIAASQWRPQETVRIAGVTGATGFNGNWKIYGTAATTNHPGPGWVVIDYGSPPSCTGFAGGFINNISVGPSWGSYATCTDKTGVNDPGANSSTSAFGATTEGCTGQELDVIVDAQDSTTGLTDANEQRIISHLVAIGRGFSTLPHVGIGQSIVASAAIIDKGWRFKSATGAATFGIGIDFTDATIDGTGTSQPAINMADGQEIIFSGGTADATRRSLRSSSGVLVYRADGANRWQVDDTGTMLAGSRVTVTAALPSLSTCGTSPAVTAGSSNNGGSFTLGTGSPTACTVTFNSAYANTAFCTVTPRSSLGAVTYYISSQSKTAFTVTLSAGTDSAQFNYTCFGN